jgi:hypothetical protein
MIKRDAGKKKTTAIKHTGHEQRVWLQLHLVLYCSAALDDVIRRDEIISPLFALRFPDATYLKHNHALVEKHGAKFAQASHRTAKLLG